MAITGFGVAYLRRWPWVAVKRRGALLLTGPDGKDARTVVAGAMKDWDTSQADAMLVVANPAAIPQVKRENPAKGKSKSKSRSR